MSILAVNQYSLEKTYMLLPGLREAGVTDAKNLAGWTVEEIASHLRAGGCDRGRFMTNLFAQRLHAFGESIRETGIAGYEQMFASEDRSRIERMLSPIKGIGPVVLKNFFLLRGLQEN
jgi:hypothetical protein